MLDVWVVLATGLLWVGLLILFIALVFVRSGARSRRMLVGGALMVIVALAALVQLFIAMLPGG